MNDSRMHITLDVRNVASRELVEAKKGDDSRRVYISLRDGSRPYVVSNDCTAVLTAKKPDGSRVYDECAIENGQIVCAITQQLTEMPGELDVEIKLYSETGKHLTSPTFRLLVDDTVYTYGDEVEDPGKPTRLLVAPHNCQVGQYFRIAEVNEAGTAVRVEAVDSPAGYYSPVFDQTDKNTVTVTLTKSEDWMPDAQDQTIALPAGPAGPAGGVASVAGKGPDPESGDVALTAADVGARPDSWMPGAADVGALPTTGGSMTGAIHMQGQAVTGLNDPAGESDAARKGYVDKVTEAFVRPNLLDNWYFGNPVNQRGLTVYMPAWGDYTIDRWNVEASGGLSITLEPDGLLLENNGTDAVNFKQRLENSDFSGENHCVSALVDEVNGTVTLAAGMHDSPWNPSAVTYITTPGLHSALGSPYIGDYSGGWGAAITLAPGTSVKIKAVKLELGNTQTLAHQDEQGNWALNEIPDYGEQLARCQRYQIDICVNKNFSTIGTGLITQDGNADVVIPIPVTMRTLPVITFSGSLSVKSPTDTVNVTGVSLLNIGTGCIMLRLTTTLALPAGEPCVVYSAGNASLMIDCNL